MSTPLPLIRLAGTLGALGVGAGSYGAHGLQASWQQRGLDLDDDSMQRWKSVWNTGWVMNMSGSAATLGLAGVHQHLRRRPHVVVALIGGGTLLFSSSAYAAAYTTDRKYSVGAPVGGTCVILGYALLALFP